MMEKMKSCLHFRVKFGHLKTINNTILAVDWMNLEIDSDVNLERKDSEIINFKGFYFIL